MKFKVCNFKYNGFCGTELPGMADYTATFKEWTNDPGIGVFQCSDGKERLIPTFALLTEDEERFTNDMLPAQKYKEGGPDIFGTPSHS